MPDLLIELFSEEIPARMQARAATDLKRLVTDGIVEAGLTYAHAGALVTPRRLVLALEGVAERSPDSVEERRGPKVGAPEKAVEGFLRGAGVAREDLEVRPDKKGEVYFARIHRAGRPAAEIVAEVLEAVIRGFPWPKSMRWGEGTLRWVRPLHRILCVLTGPEGAEVVPLEVDGIRAGDVTEGHRFMAPGEIRVSSFDDYQAKLKRAFVMLDPEERAETIRAEAQNMAFAGGLEVVEDAALLSEVAGLVEWPVVFMGEIEARFLDLPPEVLQTSMREHQKFFSVRDPGDGAHRALRHRGEPRDGGSRGIDPRRQPAGAGGAARGCGVLLGERPRGGQGRHGGLAGGARGRDVPRQTGLRGGSGGADRGAWRRSWRRPSGRTPRRRSGRRGSPKPIWSRKWSTSSPNCRG